MGVSKDKKSMGFTEVTEIELPKIKDLRGNLSFIEEQIHVPFNIQRTYWIYDVPGGEERGGHAYTNSNELIIPISGGFTVKTVRGEEKKTFALSQTNKGLFIPQLTWRKMTNFLSNSVCLVLSDTHYDDCEYIRDFSTYIKQFNLTSF